jgi:hypothetical protein
MPARCREPAQRRQHPTPPPGPHAQQHPAVEAQGGAVPDRLGPHLHHHPPGRCGGRSKSSGASPACCGCGALRTRPPHTHAAAKASSYALASPHALRSRQASWTSPMASGSCAWGWTMRSSRTRWEATVERTVPCGQAARIAACGLLWEARAVPTRASVACWPGAQHPPRRRGGAGRAVPQPGGRGEQVRGICCVRTARLRGARRHAAVMTSAWPAPSLTGPSTPRASRPSKPAPHRPRTSLRCSRSWAARPATTRSTIAPSLRRAPRREQVVMGSVSE